MTAARANVAPRLLTARDAADYFNLSVAAFERLRIGRVCFGPKVLYDRVALDAYLDQLAGLAPIGDAGAAGNDDSPEAALARFTARFENAPRRP